MFGHCQPLSGLPASFVAGSNIASVGVYIFLAISGYLVTGNWLRQPSLPFFLLKRAIRIFPGLPVAVLLTTFALDHLMTGAEQIIKPVRQRWPWLKHLFADGGYNRGWLMSQEACRDFVIEIVRKLSDEVCFQPLPRRWVVERTFGWMTRWRRLARLRGAVRCLGG